MATSEGQMTPDEFIARWEGSGGAELANSQSFLKELCDLLEVDQPEPTQADSEQNRYVFEKAVEFNNGDGTFSFGRVDLYRAGCFVLESKQGSERKSQAHEEMLATKTKQAKKLTGTAKRGTQQWDRAMQAARRQAKGYAEAIPDEWPPFLVVVDVGYCFDLYADFSGSGKNYVPFPDPRSFRIPLSKLRDQKTREMLRALWLDPHSLDPSKRAAQVTREIAERLAKLAKSLEAKHDPEVVAGFLMRCLFTMFAEDVELIRKGGFTELLLSLRFELHNFQPMVENLWEAMDEGKFSFFLREKVRHFNGKFFKQKTALPMTADQLELLIEAANHDWQYVEPAIFGTLLERALDPVERHKLGAHFTLREYVERLVMPTIIEPLREEWDAVYAAAVQLADDGKRKEAIRLLRDFHGKLCEIRVLDPACGSGNFLYVAMELMKRLEGEVVSALASFGDTVLPGITIDPHQFLGIEVNPRAAAIAELVLWIGFIQWHRRTRNDVTPPEPILRDYHNIECRDAVLNWDSIEPVVDADGKPVTRWDGRTTKTHPVTGDEVPDETAQVQEFRYVNPTEAVWPKADFIVGNPPFIPNRKFRREFGDGYVNALNQVFRDITQAVDFVMYFWSKAAAVCLSDEVRVGLITTSRIRMVQNQSVVLRALENGIAIFFAIPDHPWRTETGDASVRVAMTAFSTKSVVDKARVRLLHSPDHECSGPDAIRDRVLEASELIVREVGCISGDLSYLPDVSDVVELKAYEKICSAGMKPYAKTLVIDDAKALELFGEDFETCCHCPVYYNGRDVANLPRGARVIDFFGVASSEISGLYPLAYQYLIDYTKEERKAERNERLRREWWLFEANRAELRAAISSIPQYIATVENSPARYFVRLSNKILPDQKLRVIACDDTYLLGLLSSTIHSLYSQRLGGRHGVANTPVYNTRCITTFPLPVGSDATRKCIGELGQQLDMHRRRQQEKHQNLTMTGMYNVLEKLRSGEPLTAKEQTIHEQGLVSVLKQIHDDLDSAVFDAYGWPHDLTDEEILQRLVDLNHERAEEEKRGIIRWLRPEFQSPETATQKSLELADKEPATSKKTTSKTPKEKIKKQPWPEKLPDRMVAVRNALEKHAAPADAKLVASFYTRSRTTDVAELLDTLVAVGSIRQLDDGRYATGV